MAQNALMDILQGASNAAASNIGGPVDGLSWLLRKAGVPVPQNALGGSEWMAQRGLTMKPRNALAGAAGETLGLLAPIAAAAKAPEIARGLLAAGDDFQRYNQALGPVGVSKVFGGELAQTADKAALSKAQQLEKAGADQRAIWSDTGWFKGGDGKWRFEIDDSGAKFVGDGRLARAPDAVSHPGGLFNAYPDMKEIGVKADALAAPGGNYQRGLGMEVINIGGSKDRASIALHELQHAIQGREGFARGGNLQEMESSMGDMQGAVDKTLQSMRDEIATLQKARASIRGSNKALPSKDFRALPEVAKINERIGYLSGKADPRIETYYRLAGEAEARAVQSRMSMSAAQRRATFPLDSYDVPANQLIYRSQP